MNGGRNLVRSLALALAAMCGCATYRPAPLEPAAAARRFESRSLSEPGLCAYLRENIGAKPASCPPQQWDLAVLTLAGFYFNPQIAVAQAQVEQADAATITAGARPNPTVGLGPEYSTHAIPSVVPWGLGAFNLDLRIETAGKRGYRIAQAERQADAAKLRVGQMAWAVRSHIRTALAAYLLDIRQGDLWRENINTLGQTTRLLRQRLEAGEASQPQVSLARSLLADAKVKAAQAAARVSITRNRLAAAVGVPVDALDGARLVWPGLDRPPSHRDLSPAEVQRLALLNRIDLRVELARYAATDEALKLEIARQYPDINLVGGYAWDAGDNVFDLGPSIVLPVFNQNQGPIAEAQARRRELAAEFLATQSAIIGQARGALENYRGALAALDAAEQAAQLQNHRLHQAQQAFAVGEVDALALTQERLQYLAARQTRLAALSTAQNALGALEDVVQRPLDTGDVGSFTFPHPRTGTTDHS
jgi:outer membrane protein, heavy metal efflux system